MTQLNSGDFAACLCLALQEQSIDLDLHPPMLKAAEGDALILGGEDVAERASVAMLAAARHLELRRAPNSPVFAVGAEDETRARMLLNVLQRNLELAGIVFVPDDAQLSGLSDRISDLAYAADSSRSSRIQFRPTEPTVDESIAVSVLAAWIRQVVGVEFGDPSGCATQLAFEGMEEPAPPVTAYLVCALTRCTSEQRAELVSKHRLVKTALRERLGIEAHLPSDFTDPHLNPDIPPGDVHATDYSAVIASDVLVVLADEPSYGGGKEIAWAEQAGALVILASPGDERASRLLSGSPHPTPEIRYTSPDDLVEQVVEVVEASMFALVEHARSRQRISRRPLRRTLGGLRRATRASLPGHLSHERFDEMVSDETHLVNSTIRELFEAANVAGMSESTILRSLDDDVRSGAQHHPASVVAVPLSLTHAQLAALADASELNAWTGVEVTELMDRALTSLAKVGTYRRALTTVEDWESLRERT